LTNGASKAAKHQASAAQRRAVNPAVHQSSYETLMNEVT